MVTATAIADFLNRLLTVTDHPDYPQALNGLQLANRSAVSLIGAAVDVSTGTITKAREAKVRFLIVHHGLFWGGLQPIVGPLYDRIHSLIEADVALYSVHLPLDSHTQLGNAALLARRLGLDPIDTFAAYDNVHLGVAGSADIATADLLERVTEFAREHRSAVRTTALTAEQRTRRWAICTGAGASSSTLREAAQKGIDTLIVGEGPHHTAVEASELGIAVLYAGHYATETLGVQAIAERAAAEFGLDWIFLANPTGL